MKFTPNHPPRTFEIGHGKVIRLKDTGRMHLQPDEQVTFVTENGAEYDVVRKSWGFYATPSTNGRLRKFGWRTVLVKSPSSKYYIFLVEGGKEAEFQRYLEVERQSVVCWLDSEESLETIENRFEQTVR